MTLPFWRLAAFGLDGAAGALLAGCDDSYLDTGPGRSEHPISSATLAEMAKIDTTPSSPVLIRTYKKEAELEIWKMKSDGHYALLKTYPMCRWSGQLGPKTREGDMQVPEGFYTIAPGQMNPNSHYYLSFNVGYPNAYDRAYGRTGGSVMVHGVCSSAGCFSMTDEQVDDIYAIARDAFRGGQREIQLQSYPVPHDGGEPGQVPARPQHRVLEGAQERLRPFRGHARPSRRSSSAASITCSARPRTGRSPRPRPVPRSIATRTSRRRSPRRRPRTSAKVAELVASGRQADPHGLRGRRAEPRLRRLQGHQRSRRARFGPAGDRAGGAGFPRRQDRCSAGRRQTRARQHHGADQRHDARRSGRASCRRGGCDRRSRRRTSGQGRQKGREEDASCDGGRRIDAGRSRFRAAAADPDGRARVDLPAGQFGRRLGRKHVDNEEVAPSRRPGPGAASGHRLCSGPAEFRPTFRCRRAATPPSGRARSRRIWRCMRLCRRRSQSRPMRRPLRTRPTARLRPRQPLPPRQRLLSRSPRPHGARAG